MILAELVQLVPGGVEEERGSDYVEYAIYGPPGELPELPDLQAAAGGGLVEIETTEIPDDWADRWRDFHEPVVVGGGRLVVRPSWESDAGDAAEVDIVVDPGRAFGTGAHATTRSCLELMLDLADRGEATGAARRLGYRVGRVGDRGGEARLGSRRRLRSREARRRGRNGERCVQRRRGAGRAGQPPRGGSTRGPDGRRQPDRSSAPAARRPDRGRRGGQAASHGLERPASHGAGPGCGRLRCRRPRRRANDRGRRLAALSLLA